MKNEKNIQEFYLMITEYLKSDAKKSKELFLQDPSDFNAGILQGYYNVLSLIRSQAEIFSESLDLDLKDFNISDFDPDSELFSKK